MTPRIDKQTTGPELTPLLTMQDVARVLSVSARKFEQMVAAGEAPEHIRFGRLRRWQSDVVRAWIDLRQHHAQSPGDGQATSKRTA
jgi:excisionase family DNA binding protein